MCGSFGYGDPQYFAMFSDAGDIAVYELVTALLAALEKGTFADEGEAARYFARGLRTIEDAGHGEIHDTAVREAMIEAIEPAATKAGFDGESIVLHYF
jgi:hypothetical protein